MKVASKFGKLLVSQKQLYTMLLTCANGVTIMSSPCLQKPQTNTNRHLVKKKHLRSHGGRMEIPCDSKNTQIMTTKRLFVVIILM